MMKDCINIFLAEDDEDDVLFFKDALEDIKTPFTLTIFDNGQDLLTTLLTDKHKAPDIIFLDVNMPVKNGLECLSEIRVKPALHTIPIVILTTSASQFTINTAFKLGASLFVKKPFSLQDLQKLIEDVLTINWATHPAPASTSDFIYRAK